MYCFLSSAKETGKVKEFLFSLLREGFLPTVAPTGSHALAHGGEALLLPPVLQGLCGPIQLAGPHADSLGHQEFQVRSLSQDIRTQIIPSQTSRDVG